MSNRELRKLIASVREAERMTKPDPAWVEANRAALLTRVRDTLPNRVPKFGVRIRALVQSVIPPSFLQILRGPMAAVLAVLVIALGGSIASVNASERSLPGDWLYPIKIAAEQTRLALTSDKADKLRLKTEFVGRRLEEIKGVAASTGENKPERLKEAAGVLRRDLDTVKKQLNDVKQSSSSKDATEAAKYLDQKSTDIAAELNQMKQSLSSEEKNSVSEAQIAAVNTGVKAMEVLIENKDNPDSQGVVTDQELSDSITTKVQSLEANIAATSQKLNFDVASSTMGTTSTTQPVSAEGVAQPATATSTILFANMTLLQAKILLENNQLNLIPEKLLIAIQAMNDAEDAAQKAESEQLQEDALAGEPVDEAASSTEAGSASSNTSSTSTQSSEAAASDDTVPPQ